MITHLPVAGELLIGSINGIVHVVPDNLQFIKSLENKNNYLKRINDLQADDHNKYKEILKKYIKLPCNGQINLHVFI